MFILLKRFTTIAVSIFLILSLQGCITAAVVGTAAVATKVATDPRTTGRQIDDETLEEKINYYLNKDEQLRSEARLNVVSYSGKVLLIGQVPNESVREVARSVAAGVSGVTQVYNETRVGPKINIAQISKDSWITTQVKSKLLVNAEVKTTEVKVITENGEVFLMGNLGEAQANTAADVARNVSGVNRVVKVFTYVR